MALTSMKYMKVTDDIEFAYHDSGAPPGKADDYTTIVIIHGYTYHSGASLFFTSNAQQVSIMTFI
jgi:alpha-beta hydrolase superfamily lysophospholipase